MKNTKKKAAPIEIAEGVELIPLGYCDEERFIRLFREVWEQIPQYHLRKYWDSFPAAVTVQVQDLLSNADPSMKFELFETGHRGRELRFWAPAINTMPDSILKGLICHALGYVMEGWIWGHATGPQTDFNKVLGGSRFPYSYAHILALELLDDTEDVNREDYSDYVAENEAEHQKLGRAIIERLEAEAEEREDD